MATNSQLIPELMTHAESLTLAWENFRDSNGGRKDRHYLGLKLAQACCDVRKAVRRQGGSKGSGFQGILDQTGIPMQTAYHWIEKLEKEGDPEEWLSDARARYDAETEMARESGRRASRIFQRKLRAAAKTAETRVKTAEASLAQALTDLEVARAKLAKAEAGAEVITNKLADPAKYLWLSANEVAEAFGVHRATLFRNLARYPRLRRGPKGKFLTSSVIDQINNPPKK